jgi:hypothetical protein
METKGSSPSSQEPSTGPYPKPDQSNPYRSIIYLQDPSQYYPPTCGGIHKGKILSVKAFSIGLSLLHVSG